jgi:hypothetical protein
LFVGLFICTIFARLHILLNLDRALFLLYNWQLLKGYNLLHLKPVTMRQFLTRLILLFVLAHCIISSTVSAESMSSPEKDSDVHLQLFGGILAQAAGNIGMHKLLEECPFLGGRRNCARCGSVFGICRCCW